MKGFVAGIEKLTDENADFRRVLYTGNNLQLVLMAIQPGEQIGEEVHDDRDQFFRIEEGAGEVRIDGNRSSAKAATRSSCCGARHNVVITGDKPLRLYTCMHRPAPRSCGARSGADADAAEEHFDGSNRMTPLSMAHSNADVSS